ncbi:PREDICTED: mevalonate kinase [Dufourea novaeangliae]|uniref:Mevalonate kinase n=1 Tax=Dufourea novaeangliae TaxID=178035 RepID=A0A154PLJ5_DUFNO|nr:PREDICTED: mevalonate kinase [Dufourea novaeangliae]KZC12739.1 Mevalonate kinase [Dufourea novaeangliae]
MIQFKVSAPGKVILYGEHAVVYGKTALAASLGLRTVIDFSELLEAEQVIKICFPKVNLFITIPLQQVQSFLLTNKDSTSAENYEIFYNQIKEFVSTIGYFNLQQKLSLEVLFYLLIYITQKDEMNIKPFQIQLNTELSISSGLGSSASFAVCIAACFLHWSRLQKNNCKPFDISDLDIISKYALNCERIMHGTPSGIDNSVCTYGSMIEFKKGDYIKTIATTQIMRILLVDTRVSRSTKALVEKMAALKHKYPAIIDLIIDSIDNIAKEAIKVIQKINNASGTNNETLVEGYRQLMTLINMNQGLLATCQVSHPSLDRICAEAQNYALAAKLTGAGGGGYAYILLLPDTQPETIASISRKLIADGFTVILTTLGGAGVQIHKQQ